MKKQGPWEIVSGIAVLPDLAAGDPQCRGVVVARPHATGWFLTAHHRPDLDTEEIAHFAEFAKVRAYLLITQGPTPGTWAASKGGEWTASSLATDFPFADIVPDAVPAHWR